MEWIHARNKRQIGEVDSDFHDKWGQGVDPGNIGISLGDEVMIEGTQAEVIEWAERLLSVARSATAC